MLNSMTRIVISHATYVTSNLSFECHTGDTGRNAMSKEVTVQKINEWMKVLTSLLLTTTTLS